MAQAGSNDEKNWRLKILLDCPSKLNIFFKIWHKSQIIWPFILNLQNRNVNNTKGGAYILKYNYCRRGSRLFVAKTLDFERSVEVLNPLVPDVD